MRCEALNSLQSLSRKSILDIEVPSPKFNSIVSIISSSLALGLRLLITAETSALSAIPLIPSLSAAAEKAAEKIDVFPATAYYAFIIYENLAVFWVGILGLLVIIRMKLREIERIQKMGIDREDDKAPLLQ